MSPTDHDHRSDEDGDAHDDADRLGLRADCSRCFGLCCVAPGFAASADFAIDKDPGRPCPHLGTGFGCAIHEELRGRGFPGCAVFDCLGAGQRVAQVTFSGRDWRRHPELADQMFEVFAVMRGLHELLWWLGQARSLPVTSALDEQLRRAEVETERLAAGTSDGLRGTDHGPHRRRVERLLVRAGDGARAASGFGSSIDRQPADLVGADLVATDLRGRDLRGGSLRRACLLGADLRQAHLDGTDLRAADLRAADLRGARLARALFVTQPQIDAARGDAATVIPVGLHRPVHWTGGGDRPSRDERAPDGMK